MPNIKTTFAIRHIETRKLLSLELEIDSWGDDTDGFEVEANYTVELHGQLPVWETDSLCTAVIIASGYKTDETNYMPRLGHKTPSEFEVVAIQVLNDSIKVITNTGVPQSIFEIIKDIPEFIAIRHTPMNDTTKYDFLSDIDKYEENPDEYKMDAHLFAIVWDNLEKQSRIPVVPIDFEKIEYEMRYANDSLQSLKEQYS